MLRRATELCTVVGEVFGWHAPCEVDTQREPHEACYVNGGFDYSAIRALREESRLYCIG